MTTASKCLRHLLAAAFLCVLWESAPLSAQSVQDLEREVHQLEEQIQTLKNNSAPDVREARRLQLKLADRRNVLTGYRAFLSRYPAREVAVDGFKYIADAYESIHASLDDNYELFRHVITGQVIRVEGYILLPEKEWPQYYQLASRHHPADAAWYERSSDKLLEPTHDSYFDSTRKKNLAVVFVLPVDKMLRRQDLFSIHERRDYAVPVIRKLDWFYKNRDVAIYIIEGVIAPATSSSFVLDDWTIVQ